MAAAITDFLSSATLLYQQVLHATNDATDHENAHESVARFTRLFERHLAQLDHHDSLLDSRNQADSTSSIAKACWKISQDILLRLRRAPNAANSNFDGTCPASIGFAWTSHDAEALGARITDLNVQWRQIQPSDSEPLTTLAATLSSLRRKRDDRFIKMNESISASSLEEDLVQKTAPMAVLANFILDGLSFSSMRNREDEVAEAHDTTFDWLFQYNLDEGEQNGLGIQFAKWLQSDELGNIYWVTGKPGAGKSTLMRYVAEHESTTLFLESWCNKTRLAKAVFYFWTSGSEEQRSQTGLLRYLLHQLLSDNLDLVPKTFPVMWQRLSTMTTKERIRFTIEWDVTTLMEAFHLFMHHALKTMKICLFVDGLDEFDGDHEAIVHFFKDLASDGKGDRVKLCLSSRPWSVFEEAFQYSVPNLKLQELTYDDMTKYVNDHLDDILSLTRLSIQENSTIPGFVQSIVNRAEGVFLWVHLVVRKILEIYGNEPDIVKIQAFVDSLPSDLDSLFDRFLFQDQTTNGLQLSAHIFQLVHAREVVARFTRDESASSLSIWEIASALQHEPYDPEEPIEPEETSDEDILERSETALNSVHSGSTGLLEIYTRRNYGNLFTAADYDSSNVLGTKARKLAESRVTYLHRTVRDYLVSSVGIWKRLVSHSSADFDPHICLLKSHILQLKYSLYPIERHRRLDEWYPDIALSLTHARHVFNDPYGTQVALLNQLDSYMSWYWLSRAGDPYDHWARSCFGTYEQRKGNRISFDQPFLALCTKFGAERYVLDTLDALALQSDYSDTEDTEDEDDSMRCLEETPLLTYALEFLTSRQKTIMPLSSPSFITALLQSPHLKDPKLVKLIGTANMLYDSPLARKSEITPWIMVLSHLRDAKRRGWIEPFDTSPDGTERWAAIVKMLATDGEADMNAFLKWNGFDKECWANDVLVGVEQLGAVDDWWVYQFKDLFIKDSV